jgi:hypothetical protein
MCYDAKTTKAEVCIKVLLSAKVIGEQGTSDNNVIQSIIDLVT